MKVEKRLNVQEDGKEGANTLWRSRSINNTAAFIGKGWSFILSDRDLEQINNLLKSQNLPLIYKDQRYNHVNINRNTYTIRILVG